MGQVTIYLEDELAGGTREHAKRERVSQSRWIARLIEEKLATIWPEPARRLAGASADFPELEALRHPQGEDVLREARRPHRGGR